VRIEITDHALERFVERGGLVHPDPEAALREMVESGGVLREKAASGHELREAGGLRFVCDRRPGVLVVVTVLRAGDSLRGGTRSGQPAAVAPVDAGDAGDYTLEAAAALARLVEEEERLTHEARRAELVFAALQRARNNVRKAIRQLAGESVVQ
jgi:hypothetical protein